MILTEKLPRYLPYHQTNVRGMNILLVKKEILPSNQKQIIEQAPFTYSPLGKAFEKQIKTTEDLKNKTNRSNSKPRRNENNQKIWLYWWNIKIFNRLVDERLEEITKLDKKGNFDDLIYRYKGSTDDEKFNEFDNAFTLLDKIRDGKKYNLNHI